MKKKQLNAYQYAKQIWWFTSLKNSNTQWCESLLERDYLLSLEFDESVERYLSQPSSFLYIDKNGQDKRYTPDTLVRTTKEDLLKEVKPTRYVDENLLSKLSHINDSLLSRNLPRVNVVTDDDIRKGYQISNFKLMYRYKAINIERCYASPMLAEIDTRISYGDLIALARAMKQPPVLPVAMISHQILAFDVTKTLHDRTLLEVNYA